MSISQVKPLRILHAEDDHDLREIMALALELTASVDLLQCESGEEVIEKIVDFTPDVVLLDVFMPKMSGPMVLSHIRKIKEFGNLPVIFVTGRVSKEEVDKLMALGASSVIAKPFEPMEVFEMIESALRKRPN